MPEEHTVLIHGDSFHSKLQTTDDEKAALLAAEKQFLPLETANENDVHARQGMTHLEAEQTSENAERYKRTNDNGAAAASLAPNPEEWDYMDTDDETEESREAIQRS